MRTHARAASRAWKMHVACTRIMIMEGVLLPVFLLLHMIPLAVAAAIAMALCWKAREAAGQSGRKHFLRSDTQRGIPTRVDGEYTDREMYRMAKAFRKGTERRGS
jgi:hypothetical protein